MSSPRRLQHPTSRIGDAEAGLTQKESRPSVRPSIHPSSFPSRSRGPRKIKIEGIISTGIKLPPLCLKARWTERSGSKGNRPFLISKEKKRDKDAPGPHVLTMQDNALDAVAEEPTGEHR